MNNHTLSNEFKAKLAAHIDKLDSRIELIKTNPEACFQNMMDDMDLLIKNSSAERLIGRFENESLRREMIKTLITFYYSLHPGSYSIKICKCNFQFYLQEIKKKLQDSYNMLTNQTYYLNQPQRDKDVVLSILKHYSEQINIISNNI